MAEKKNPTWKDFQTFRDGAVRDIQAIKAENLRDIAAIHRSVKEFKQGAAMEMAELRKIVESQSRALGQIRTRPVPPKTDPN